MAARIEAGWDHGVVGTASILIKVGANAQQTASITSGTYCHTDLSSVMGTGEYDNFSAALKAALDAIVTAAQTYTVTYSPTAYTYTISATNTFTVEFPATAAGTLMKQILGFSGNRTTATSHVSDVRPFYVLDVAAGGWTRASDDYEPEEIVVGAVADSGRVYAVGRTETVIFNDFTVPLEEKAVVFDRNATAAVPWTWSHFFQHVRGTEPFLRADPYDVSVHKLRPEGASFRPERAIPDYDAYWSVPLRTYNLGYL